MQPGDDAESPSFPPTRWTLVRRAGGDPAAPEAGEAAGELLRRYLPAMRAHLLGRMRVPPADVDDLLQGFVAAKVLERNLFAAARQERGRFRTFLLTSLERYVLNCLRNDAAAKRSPAGGRPASLDVLGDVLPASEPGPDAFDVAWAQEVVREAVRRTQRECEMAGRSDLWTVFHARVAAPLLEGAEPAPYDRLVAELKYESPAQATNALVTGKRTFARMLRSVVGEYALDEAEVEREIAELREVLKRSGT